MAENQTPALVVVALLLLAAVTPLAHGQTLKGLNFFGTFCCTSTGNCVGGAPGVSGAPLVVNCTSITGSVVTVAQGVTGPTGAFNLSSTSSLLNLIGSIVGGFLPCEVIVSLPLNSTICPILSTASGVLAALPQVVNTVISAATGGLIANLKVTGFVNATVG